MKFGVWLLSLNMLFHASRFCMCICVQLFVDVCGCACIGGPTSTLGVVLQESSALTFRQVLSLGSGAGQLD